MRALSAPSLVAAESRRVEYLATIPAGVELSDILDPSYWKHVAEKLRPLYKISCWWEDGTRYAELLVLRVSHAEAHCIELLDKPLNIAVSSASLAKELEKYEIGFAGADVGYRVVRKADREVIKSDVNGTQETMMAWLVEHLSRPASGRAAPPVAPKKPEAKAKHEAKAA